MSRPVLVSAFASGVQALRKMHNHRRQAFLQDPYVGIAHYEERIMELVVWKILSKATIP